MHVRFMKNRLSGAVPVVVAPRIGVGEAVGLVAASLVPARNKSDRLHFHLRVSRAVRGRPSHVPRFPAGGRGTAPAVSPNVLLK
jgi:hypothetical protein